METLHSPSFNDINQTDDGDNKNIERQVFDNEICNNDSNNGMSIFGFDNDEDDDDDNEESLLVSPILSNYLPNKNNSKTNNHKNELFKSPPRSHRKSTTTDNNSFLSLTSLSPSPSSSMTKSSQQRLRSSARLRRRREILFSSPMEQKFQIEEQKQELQLQEQSEKENNNGREQVVVDNIVKLIHDVEEDVDGRRNKFLLLGGGGGGAISSNGNGVLDTSLCPSLGLGSTSGSYDNEQSRSYYSTDKSSSEEDKYKKKNHQHRHSAEKSIEDNDDDLSFSNDEGYSPSPSIRENEQVVLKSHDHQNGQGKDGGDSDQHKISNSDECYSTDEHDGNIESQENHDRSSIQSFLHDLEGVYTIPNKDEEHDIAQLSLQSPEKRNDKSFKPVHQTPPRSVSRGRKSLTLTPKLREVVEKTLTPVLNALRSKLLDSKSSDHDKLSNLTSMVQESEKKKVSFIDDKPHSDFKSSPVDTPPLGNVPEERTSLTPALKSLRSKLYNGVEAKDKNVVDDENSIENEIAEESILNTPGSVEHGGSTSKVVKTKTSLDSELSLTPALKALRSKILRKSSVDLMPNSHSLSTISPITDANLSPKVMQETLSNRGSLFSPPEREPVSLMKTPKTSASDKNQSQVTDGDDSYFAQPKDLSSAKKNLNAQSSALVERLRGAAQRRMVQLTQKRDSLAAKEIQQLQRKELDSIMNEIIEEEDSQAKRNIEEMTDEEQSKRKPINNTFKARPMPSFAKQGGDPSGVPEIIKKPTTKPISPKLGPRRQESSSSCSLKEKNQNDAIFITSFKARPMPKFTNNDGVKQVVPKAKKRQITIPKSPLLGLKRQQNTSIKKLVHNNNKSERHLRKRNQPKVLSPDLVGLSYLSRTPSVQDIENIPPHSNEQSSFYLHSAERAKDRAKFNAELAQREKLREKQKRKENELLIKKRIQELEILKKTLR
jgi:hypothetical protein